MKLDKRDKIHIAIIILGIVFVGIPVFHTSLWFDECYSVAICNHTFKEIWTIGAHDVHPVLYYLVLHIINLIFGNNILMYRLFSYVCICIMGILGFTHIRKDFGKITGILFSFFSLFLPIMVVYAGEIRMYSLAMLLVTIMCIYAYRIYKNQGKIQIKNWIIFGVCSLASAYTHYYGLMAAGIVNVILFIYFLIKCIKQKKFTTEMKSFIISAVIQIAIYIPWIVNLLWQMNQVSHTFWIEIKPDILLEFLTFQFTGNLNNNIIINKWLALSFSIVICTVLIYAGIKNRTKKDVKDREYINLIKLSLAIYFGIIIAATLMSLIMFRPIIYARYMLCVTGVFIFFLSYYLSKNWNKYIITVICILCIAMSIFIEVILCKQNYDPNNNPPFDYLKENVKENDIILCSTQGSGFIVSANFPDNFLYFWDASSWNVEEAYKAFGKHMKTIYSLDEIADVKGRIWIIDAGTDELLNKVQDRFDITVLEKKNFSTAYHLYQYSFALVEK